MSQYLPNKLTPLSPQEAIEAIYEGYKAVTGSAPSLAVLAMLVGQSALETGNWRSMHNFNFGNIRGHGPGGLFTSFRAGEIENGKEVFYEEGDPRNKFAAYENARDAGKHYVKTMQDHPNWWDGLHTGTVEGFIKGLTTYPAYFTANPHVYANVLQERMNKFADDVKPFAKTSFWAAIGAGVAATTGFFIVRRYRG